MFKKKNKTVSHIYLLIVVFFGWILFKFENINDILTVLKGMFCINGNEFFDFENANCDLKSSSSKVYPILRKMEDNGLIRGEWQTVNNKRVKFYCVTEDGEIVLNHIRISMQHVFENSNWLYFIEDMTGKKVELVNLNECN